MTGFGLGVWSHRISEFGDERDVVAHAQKLSERGFGLVIPCVRNPLGAVDFFTDVADVNERYPEWDPLKVLIQLSVYETIKAALGAIIPCTHVWSRSTTPGPSSATRHPSTR